MSITKEQLEELFNSKLEPLSDGIADINSKLQTISRDLGEIRRDLGYDNLRVIKNVENKEEM